LEAARPKLESHCPKPWRISIFVFKRNECSVEGENFRSMQVSKTCSRIDRKENFGKLR
jgi:hypothetical protein